MCFFQIRHLENSTCAIKRLISNCIKQNARLLRWHQKGERCTSYKTSYSNNIYLQKADASVRTHINQGSFFFFPTLLDSYYERTASLTYRRPSREKVEVCASTNVFLLKSPAIPEISILLAGQRKTEYLCSMPVHLRIFKLL
jgi:hypothetical protein